MHVARSTLYYRPAAPSLEHQERELRIKARLDYWHTKMPALGARKLKEKLRVEGIAVGRKLIRRYMREMGIYVIYPKLNLSKGNAQHKKNPYLLRNLDIYMPNQVWAIDITYIPMKRGICTLPPSSTGIAGSS